ncbi:hypothetical protein Scep_030134 [Stephania cephalantha]|uniref:Uncharacterized protein n=1 Tax=Stephania cephalantha TaxID=152367 RepID=A0AAP0E6S1_9MAGN
MAYSPSIIKEFRFKCANELRIQRNKLMTKDLILRYGGGRRKKLHLSKIYALSCGEASFKEDHCQIWALDSQELCSAMKMIVLKPESSWGEMRDEGEFCVRDEEVSLPTRPFSSLINHQFLRDCFCFSIARILGAAVMEPRIGVPVAGEPRSSDQVRRAGDPEVPSSKCWTRSFLHKLEMDFIVTAGSLLKESLSSLSDEEDHVTKKVRNRDGMVFEKDAGTTVNPSFRHALVGQVMEDEMEEDKDTESEPNLDEMEDYRLNLATEPPNICFAEKIHREINARLDMHDFIR